MKEILFTIALKIRLRKQKYSKTANGIWLRPSNYQHNIGQFKRFAKNNARKPTIKILVTIGTLVFNIYKS